MSKIALITGATSGIGYATAIKFAQNGINIIICGRRSERLEVLEKEINGIVRVYKLQFDVSNREEVFNSVSSLPQDWKAIDILVNNAGNAHGLDPAQDADLNDWEMMMDINVKGLMYVTKAILPLFIKRKSGHIINISSIAGKEVYAKGNAYCASKHAVDAFTDGLRIDLLGTGIKVSMVSPGAVNTEFSLVRFKGDKERADNFYKGFRPLTGEDVAEVVWYMASLPEHINLTDVTVFPSAQVSATLIHRNE